MLFRKVSCFVGKSTIELGRRTW